MKIQGLEAVEERLTFISLPLQVHFIMFLLMEKGV